MPEHWTEKSGFNRLPSPFSHSRHMDVNLALWCLYENKIDQSFLKWGDERCSACKKNYSPFCNPKDKLSHMMRI